MSIKELPENVWSKIAAGEVVERPASAVKELVENSLDADSTKIKVILTDGGRLKIIVEDDGNGIEFNELPLASTYHATSKISEIEDLENISTLGYRGEALASIAAVADVEIISRRENAENGGLIRTKDGKIVEHIKTSCHKGTRIKIENLFSGLPARRKFLKSASG
ncbi:MAG: ATP-binding protein, partial [Synergistaceae bacterium]|nr:ATP-binding protein [Synergistaceae bacterium]